MRAVDDAALVRALQDGDEEAFRELVDSYNGYLLRLALGYVRSRAVAEEVVQETWIGVLRGIDRFQGRSSLRTWIARILANTAKTRAQREGRSIPFSSLGDGGEGEPAVDPDRFQSTGGEDPGHWAHPPAAWPTPEEGTLSNEARGVIVDAIDELPPNQRAVVTLRDVEGWPSREVCEALDVSEGNQRVLLHRGRSKVRSALERYFDA
jgi:RNA polymerase sigma-70 factor (ECF subfamily)